MVAFPLVGALALAGTANAARPAPASKGVVCTKVSGKLKSTGVASIKLSGCSDTKNTGGSGKSSGSEGGTTSTVTWNGTGTTTFDDQTDTGVTGGTCPSGDIEEEATGTVSGGTGAALKSIPIGWTYQAFICFDPSTSKLSNAPGTTYQIGAAF